MCKDISLALLPCSTNSLSKRSVHFLLRNDVPVACYQEHAQVQRKGTVHVVQAHEVSWSVGCVRQLRSLPVNL